MSWMTSLFGLQNPSTAAAPYYNQIPGAVNQLYGPYNQMGMNAGNQLYGQYSNLMSNPSGFINGLQSQYQQSPGYAWQVNQATQAANNASAAGGMLGSPQEQQQLGGTVANLANQNMSSWLGNVLGVYGQGLQGAQGMYGIGANAAGEQATSLATAYGLQGQNAAAGTQWQNNANLTGAGILGNLAGGILGKVNWSSLF